MDFKVINAAMRRSVLCVNFLVNCLSSILGTIIYSNICKLSAIPPRRFDSCGTLKMIIYSLHPQRILYLSFMLLCDRITSCQI